MRLPESSSFYRCYCGSLQYHYYAGQWRNCRKPAWWSERRISSDLPRNGGFALQVDVNFSSLLAWARPKHLRHFPLRSGSISPARVAVDQTAAWGASGSRSGCGGSARGLSSTGTVAPAMLVHQRFVDKSTPKRCIYHARVVHSWLQDQGRTRWPLDLPHFQRAGLIIPGAVEKRDGQR